MVSRKVELGLSLVNRGIPPLATYISLIAFAQFLSTEEFNNYLISMTAAMWSISSAFQWQKNATIRFFKVEDKDLSTYIASVAISTAVVTVVIVVVSEFDSRVSKLIIAFIAATGFAYVFGGIFRSLGQIKQFLLLDTLLTVLKWALGICAAFLFASTSSVFLALASGATALSITLYIFIARAGYRPRSLTPERRDNITHMFGFGAYLLLIDFFGSGFMYIDRFWFSESSLSEAYIIASNIGGQIASVIMGAFLMVAYPRIARSYKDGSNWMAEFFKYSRYFPLFAILSCTISFFASPALTSLIKEGLAPTPYLAFAFTVSQCAFYLTALTSIPYLISLKPIYPSILSGIAFIIFVIIGVSLSSTVGSPAIIVMAKTIVLLLLSAASWIIFRKRFLA